MISWMSSRARNQLLKVGSRDCCCSLFSTGTGVCTFKNCALTPPVPGGDHKGFYLWSHGVCFPAGAPGAVGTPTEEGSLLVGKERSLSAPAPHVHCSRTCSVMEHRARGVLFHVLAFRVWGVGLHLSFVPYTPLSTLCRSACQGWPSQRCGLPRRQMQSWRRRWPW